MRIAPLADVKARLSAYLEESRTKGPLVITKNGRPVGVLIAPEDEGDLERIVLARSPRFQALLARSRRSITEGRGLSEEEFWSRVESRRAKLRRSRK
jgi:prevent-host-death family protein